LSGANRKGLTLFFSHLLLRPQMGIKIFPVLHGGKGDDLVSRLPSDIDAVLIGALPRMDEAQMAKLLSNLIELGLPSYSLIGSHLVEQGALVTAVPFESWQRRTHRLALDLAFR